MRRTHAISPLRSGGEDWRLHWHTWH
jgi:hypothetical protein